MVDVSCFKISQIRPEAASVNCCGSCHIDYEDYGYDLCSVVDPITREGGNHLVGVCCSMFLYLKEHPITVDEWKALLTAEV
jgi:hypothetical protein